MVGQQRSIGLLTTAALVVAQAITKDEHIFKEYLNHTKYALSRFLLTTVPISISLSLSVF